MARNCLTGECHCKEEKEEIEDANRKAEQATIPPVLLRFQELQNQRVW